MVSFMAPECYVVLSKQSQIQHANHLRPQADTTEAGEDSSAAHWLLSDGTVQVRDVVAWLTSPAHAYVYSPLRTAAATLLNFRSRASGELERRTIPLRGAAMWLGDSLVALQAGTSILVGTDAAESHHPLAIPVGLWASASHARDDGEAHYAGSVGENDVGVVCRMLRF